MYPYKYIFPRYLQLYKYSQKCKIKTLFCVSVVLGVLSPAHHRDCPAFIAVWWEVRTPWCEHSELQGELSNTVSSPSSLQLTFSPIPCCSPLGRVLKRRWSLGWCKRRSCHTGNHSRIPNCPHPADPSCSRMLLLSSHFLPSVLQPCSDSSSLFPIRVHYCC